ncbi:MAG: C45 family autoproteolytic acyltransferase/hydrolase [Actinomycetota bacterium]
MSFIVVRASGRPFERGRAIGRGLAEAIETSLGFVTRYLEAHGIPDRSLDAVLAPYVAASEAALPAVVEQIRGMADGAEQPFSRLMAANAFEELYGQMELDAGSLQTLERCTDLVVDGPEGPLLGHTEQWYPGDEGAVGIVVDTPDDGPVVLAPVVAGTLPLVGINEHGVAVGAMSLSARDERVGIPRALVARDVLDATDADDATARATRPRRAGGYSYLMAFPDGEARAVETTATRDAVVASRTHTNHALDSAVSDVTFPALPGSVRRLSRTTSLAATIEPTVENVVAILADHDGEPESICAHPDPAEGDEGSTILFAMVAEPARRSLTIAAGHACTGSFETFRIDDLR